MAKDVWDIAREKAVASFLSKANLDLISRYDPDIIDGKQPYAGLLSGMLSMGSKKVEVTTIPSTDVDLDHYEGKKILVISDDPLDRETPAKTIDRFGPYLMHLGGFRYAVGNPIRLFTFEELEKEYGHHSNKNRDDG